MAGIYEDIEAMPMGLFTAVPEGGSTLSGGQRQRLLIARVLINKPKIIFFDEATSALDNKTQAIVSKSLDSINSTRVVIAHRLSTIIHCDRILVMDKGKIAEEGSYQELMEKKSLFYELAKRQLA
jgi:ATP-binding cassette subfamily C protein